MMIGETVTVAFSALRVSKLRSFLTMLGIVIGVAALIAMVALGSGAQQAVKQRITSLGTTLLTVFPGQMRGPGGVAAPGDRAALTLEDVDAIQQRAEHVLAIQPEMTRSEQVQYGGRSTNTSVVGTTANYLEVRNASVSIGRMFTAAEDAARKRVAILGPQVVTDLGLAEAAGLVGQPLYIGGVQFEVVGVLDSKGQGVGFGNADDQILVPLQTARFRLVGADRLRSINVLAPSEGEIPATMAELQKILRREHRLRQGDADDFTLRSQSDFLTTLGETTQVFTYLLAGIAAVSLLVGGIGIMNIMLVSVTERTREVGIRKALGARRADILLQFLIEAVVLCLLGGLVGIGLGVGASAFLRQTLHWSTAVGPSSILLAVTFATVVGVVFGVWPARRAAGLDPIESLRYE